MGYNDLIEWKTFWEKEKLLVKSKFSFSLNVFKNCLFLMRQNEYLWSKGLMHHRKALNTLVTLYQISIYLNDIGKEPENMVGKG